MFNGEFRHPDPTSVGTKAEANEKTRIGPFYNLKLFRNRRVNFKVQVFEKICMRGLQMTREFVSSGHLLQHIENFLNYRLSIDRFPIIFQFISSNPELPANE